MATKSKPVMRRKVVSKFRVGDRVWYDSGLYRWKAELIEDRGKLGVGGRRIWRIHTLSSSPGAESTFEVPEEELELARSKARKNGKS
jgi:hypothetical protein